MQYALTKNNPLESKYGSPYFDTQQLASYIHRTPGAIRNLVLRRAIPFRKPGGRLLFVKTEIDEWVASSEGVSLEEILSNSS